MTDTPDTVPTMTERRIALNVREFHDAASDYATLTWRAQQARERMERTAQYLKELGADLEALHVKL